MDKALKDKELTVESSSPRLQWLKIEDVKVPEIRLNSKFSDEELEEFKESMARDGQLQPIIVVEDEKTGEKWLVDGKHRLEALKAQGKTLVRAEVHRGKLQDAIVGSAIHNLKRGHRNPAELAKLVRYMYRNMGWTLNKIAEKLGYKSKGIISNLLKVAETPKLIKQAESGTLTMHDITRLEEVLHAEPISPIKPSSEERSLKQEVSQEPSTIQKQEVTTSLKEAEEKGKRFIPLGSEDLEPRPVKTKSAICDYCGFKVLREELKFLKLHADCYDEVVDILEKVKAEREKRFASPQP